MRADFNYLNKLNSNNLDSPYVLHVLGENVKGYLYDIKKHESLSLIHLNIRSMDSNLDKIHNLFLNCSNSFNIICVTEAWYTDKDFKNNSNFHLPSFDFMVLGKTSPGKMPPGKMPPGKVLPGKLLPGNKPPRKIAPLKIAPQEKCPPENCPPPP